MDATLHVRQVDWQVSRIRKLRLVTQDAWRTYRAARGHRAVVVATTSMDAVMLALMLRLRPSQRLAVYDFLLPRSTWGRRVSRWALRRVDVWLVIRRGDADTFRQEVGARTCVFVPFPVEPAAPSSRSEEAFVYAAGTAYRDWPTLVRAAEQADVQVVISTVHPFPVVATGSSVRVLPLLTAEQGREMIARAAVVCVPMLPTEKPSGPLVVLDALSAGKPVVATDVNGTRDYVSDGRTGLLVPPGDADALAMALRRLLGDAAERRRLGCAGRAASAAWAPALVFAAVRDAALGTSV